MKGKEALRALFHERLKGVSEKRREEAKEALFADLYKQLAPFATILSFHSFGLEISTHRLNQKLAEEGRLLLPKIEGKTLRPFFVSDLDKKLLPLWGSYREPSARLCKEAKGSEVVLVPALAFDSHCNRLGRGLGYYDRFLISSYGMKKIGLAFKEQLYEKELPCEPHDQKVDFLCLY